MCHRRLKKTSHLLGMERNDNVCRNGHDMHIIVVIYEKALSKAEENNLLSSVREKVYSIGNKVMYIFSGLTIRFRELLWKPTCQKNLNGL